jgi:hypothetical protein
MWGQGRYSVSGAIRKSALSKRRPKESVRKQSTGWLTNWIRRVHNDSVVGPWGSLLQELHTCKHEQRHTQQNEPDHVVEKWRLDVLLEDIPLGFVWRIPRIGPFDKMRQKDI